MEMRAEIYPAFQLASTLTYLKQNCMMAIKVNF